MMSWERKWKEFQTADRLDEAVGVHDPMNPDVADWRSDELAFNTAVQKKAASAQKAQELFDNLKGDDATGRNKAEGAFRQWANADPDRKEKVDKFLLTKGYKGGLDAAIPNNKSGKPVLAGNFFQTAFGEFGQEFIGAALSDDGLGNIDGTPIELGDFSDTIKPPEVEPTAGVPTDASQGFDMSAMDFSTASLPTLSPEEREEARKLSPEAAKRVRATKRAAAIKAGEDTLTKRQKRKREKKKTGGLWHKITGLDTRAQKKAKKQDLERKATMWDMHKSANLDAPTTTTPTPPRGDLAPTIRTPSQTKPPPPIDLDDPLHGGSLLESGFEKKWKNYQRIVESTSKGHLADNEFQQKMKKRRSRNDVYTKPSGARNTSKSSPFSTKAKSFGKSNIYFENLNEADQDALSSFTPKETLNPAAFDGDVMIPEIRDRLMEIAQDFLDGIDFKMDVEDITLTGSLANYNWSKYSDFDLHILVDYEAIDADPDLVKRFFQDIKAIWNIRHNIFLKGFEVEVYVQNTNESHMSSGVYSVENDEWLIKPEREDVARHPIDKPNIEKKADDISFQIDRAERLFAGGKLNDALNAIDRLKQKIRNLRKTGLSKEDGVYSVENLAFKTLRRSGELERLSTLKNKAYDKNMSIAQ